MKYILEHSIKISPNLSNIVVLANNSFKNIRNIFFAQKKIFNYPALVVVDDNRCLLGIFTEKDINRIEERDDIDMDTVHAIDVCNRTAKFISMEELELHKQNDTDPFKDLPPSMSFMPVVDDKKCFETFVYNFKFCQELWGGYRNEGIIINITEKYIEFRKENKCIRISNKHAVYTSGVKGHFDDLYNEVEKENGIVDFSAPRLHKYIGYDLHKIMVPSLPETISSTLQYLWFADLNSDSVVLDLGAYSGLSSILFDQTVSKNNPNAKGKVIAVDADVYNVPCINYNLNKYKEITGRTIGFLHCAVWNEDGAVEFSHEENMGSSATRFVGYNRGRVEKIPAYTLRTIAKRFNLEKIDFIKCDIEGAESIIFDDYIFFEKYRPKILIEPHLLYPNNNKVTTRQSCCATIEKFRYTFEEVKGAGYSSSLIGCRPIDSYKD
jgi:FkbM family methyltransferase